MKTRSLDPQSRAARPDRRSCSAFTSMAKNNGSAFAGLTTNTDWYNTVGTAIVMS